MSASGRVFVTQGVDHMRLRPPPVASALYTLYPTLNGNAPTYRRAIFPDFSSRSVYALTQRLHL